MMPVLLGFFIGFIGPLIVGLVGGSLGLPQESILLAKVSYLFGMTMMGLALIGLNFWRKL